MAGSIEQTNHFLFVSILVDMSILARSGAVDMRDEEIIDQIQVKNYFPETWLYDEKVAE